MDKALAYHTSGWGSNPNTTKVFNAPILSGAPACALTLSQCLLSPALAGILFTGKTDIREMYGRKGVQKKDTLANTSYDK